MKLEIFLWRFYFQLVLLYDLYLGKVTQTSVFNFSLLFSPFNNNLKIKFKIGGEDINNQIDVLDRVRKVK